MELIVSLKENSYPIIIEKGSINNLKDYLPLNGKVLIVSDDLIPEEYIEVVKKNYKNSFLFRIKHGENHKDLSSYESILKVLSDNKFSRKDAIIALGGGLTSDVVGFAASSYMRGIAFYIIPTTLLSQVDASVGGKVAVNYNGYKNQIGAFYQPKKVIIDPDTLKTLDKRLLMEGLAEVIKMSLTSNKPLFEYIASSEDIFNDPEKLISGAIRIKKGFVERDEKEKRERQILNFGHTVGHALESLSNGKLYHGEAVAIGMTYFVSKELRPLLIDVLKKYSLPYEDKYDIKDIIDKIKLDKKAIDDDYINIVYVKEIGKAEIRKITFKELEEMIGGRKNEK